MDASAASTLSKFVGERISEVGTEDSQAAVAELQGQRRLVVHTSGNFRTLDKFDGEVVGFGEGRILVGPTSSSNAQALRDTISSLSPVPLGLGTSAGFGDRLGLATPGHVRAVKATGNAVAPIFAQQSIREMERTNRSVREVLDDATWGALEGGWSGTVGADADHLKSLEDINYCLEAGYSFFTFDPGEYVDDRAEAASDSKLDELFKNLPWQDLESTPYDLLTSYGEGEINLESGPLVFGEREIREAAVKYGRAVLHVVKMYRHLASVASPGMFEVEVSVDETATPTTHLQHAFIARELSRLQVRWVSLAPRYVGDFEKGVDYIGDTEVFADDFALHAEIARALGPYKLSLHSGSDKFSIYEIAARETRGLIHLKTAGTSYLEALRTLAACDPVLFREIYGYSRTRYEIDRASYHVSADLSIAPESSEPEEQELPQLIEQFDAREILHVTFGSVLQGTGAKQGFRERLLEALRAAPDNYASNLEKHFVRHLEPFTPFTVRARQ